MTISDGGRAAQALPSLILAAGISERDRVRVGQRTERLGLILDADVGVTHRHVDVGVPGQFPGLGHGRPITQKLRDVGVPPGRVEVGNRH
jgi:hypothetical protein